MNRLNISNYWVRIDGIYVKKGKILLLKSNVEPFRGFWHVGCGHVEENETLKEALQREFKEESNLDVEIGEILGSRIEETFDRTKIVIMFDVCSAKGEINLNSESSEYGWFHDCPQK